MGRSGFGRLALAAVAGVVLVAAVACENDSAYSGSSGPKVAILGDDVLAAAASTVHTTLDPTNQVRLAAFEGSASSQFESTASTYGATAPQVVVLEVGTNDVLKGVDPATALANISTLFGDFPGACRVAVNVNLQITDPSFSVPAATTINNGLSARSDFVIDWNGRVAADVNGMTGSDPHIRPTASGQQVLANQIQTAIQRCGSRNVPTAVGGPNALLGADPDSGIDDNFWVTNGSYMTPKINGDRYNTSVCTAPASPGSTLMFGCSGTGTGTNTERNPDGYTFKVHNDGSGPGGSLDIQVFDPQYSNQDGFCNTNMPTASQLTTLAASTQWGSIYSNVSTRWGVGGTSGANTANMKYCPGDDDTALTETPSQPTDAIQPQNVTYIVEAPDTTATDDGDNPPICAITFGGYNTNVFPMLDKTQQGNTLLSPENVKFGTHFHAWFTICHISSPVAGDYIVHIKTTADQTNKGATPQTNATAGLNIGTLGNDIAPSTAGMQRYALRAGWSIPNPDQGTNAPPTSITSTGLDVAADSNLPIYVHGTTNTPFDLVRVTPDEAGATLVVDLWDIGDGSDESIQLVPPPDAVNPPTTCTWTRDGVDLASAGTSAMVSGCTVSNMTTGNFNGRLTTATVSIPNNYSCTPNGSNPEDCRFGVQVSYANGTPQDVTTWTANVIAPIVH
jgi:hypothetical protein